VPVGEGFPLERGRQTGVSPPKRLFAAIGFYSVKRLEVGTDLLHIITSTGDGLFRFVNIDDFE